jgi:hypothetical protein
MRTLIYKRTHKGDPDDNGCFGVEDCMGRVRDYRFDNVIGIGGISAEPRAERISGKVNWIGIGAMKAAFPGARGQSVTFKHFRLYEEKGRDFETIAPLLAHRMYSNNVRVLLNFNDAEQAEIDRILNMASTAPPSRGNACTKRSLCPPRKRC